LNIYSPSLHIIADVMGVSEVLLCPYRCLEYKMERLEKLENIQLPEIVSGNSKMLEVLHL